MNSVRLFKYAVLAALELGLDMGPTPKGRYFPEVANDLITGLNQPAIVQTVRNNLDNPLVDIKPSFLDTLTPFKFQNMP
jgi:hypothetical protein